MFLNLLFKDAKDSEGAARKSQNLDNLMGAKSLIKCIE